MTFFRGDAFPHEILPRKGGGAEIPLGQRRGQAPVHFLRERRIQVTGAQTRLDMADRHALIEGRERGRENGGGVALQQNGGRPQVAQRRCSWR